MSKTAKLKYEPDTTVADTALVDIVEDIRALRVPSDNKLALYALHRLRAHQGAIAPFNLAVTGHENALHKAFAELRALVGDPLPLGSDERQDVFDHLDAPST